MRRRVAVGVTSPEAPSEPAGQADTVLVVGHVQPAQLHRLAALRLKLHVATDAANALEVCAGLRPSLVILFPDIEPAGWEVCRAIRRSSTMPILIASTSRSLDDVEDAIAWGADDYVVLPLSAHELAEKALAAIARTARTTG